MSFFIFGANVVGSQLLLGSETIISTISWKEKENKEIVLVKIVKWKQGDSISISKDYKSKWSFAWVAQVI